MTTALPLYTALPTPHEIRQWDELATSSYGIPPVLLMENAGREAVAVLHEHVTLTSASKILVIMGGGNNGGDGAVVARLLHDMGYKVLVCHTKSLESMHDHAHEHVVMAQKIGVTFLPNVPDNPLALPLEWLNPDVIIDALTGTGLQGQLRDKECSLIQAINVHYEHSFIVSLDSPSGLCGNTGHPLPEAVRAHLTISFEAGKPGLFIPEAQNYVGKVVVRRIGIPLGTRAIVPPSWNLLAPEKGSWAFPSFLQHKGDAGRVLVIGGSEGMSGAPLLAALGSLRTGAGIVHVACPGALADTLRSGWPEVQVHGIGSQAVWQKNHVPPLLDLIQNCRPDALVVGPGMGRTTDVHTLVKSLLEASNRPPVVLDADALYSLSLHETTTSAGEVPTDILRLLTEKDILTPHPGEMARLLPSSYFASFESKPEGHHERIQMIQANRAEALRTFTQNCAAVLLLKGPGTLIGQKNMPLTLSPYAVATLAVGGSGDVLAGVCAALLASRKFSPTVALDAASLGVYLHARAGELLAQSSLYGHLARDIANTLPAAWNELCHS